MTPDEILEAICTRNYIQDATPDLDICGPWVLSPEKLSAFLSKVITTP